MKRFFPLLRLITIIIITFYLPLSTIHTAASHQSTLFAQCMGATFIFPHAGTLGWPYMDDNASVIAIDHTIHRGIDIWGHIDDEVRAAYAGTVAVESSLRINHPDLKVDTYYGHVTVDPAVVGKYVQQGDVIGRLNESGHADHPDPKASHVHFVVLKHDPDGPVGRRNELFFSSSLDLSPYLNAKLNYFDQARSVFFNGITRIFPYTRPVTMWCNATATGGITGIVKNTDGTPVKGATVIIEGTDQRRITDYGMDSIEGRYTFSNVDPGEYTITATQGNQTGSIKVTIKATTSLNVFPSIDDIILSGSVSNVVRGLVKDASTGGAVSDARVVLVSGDVKRETRTDSNGYYQFSDSPPGSVKIFAAKPNVGSNVLSIQTPINNGRASDIDLIPFCIDLPGVLDIRLSATDSCPGQGQDIILILDSSGSMIDNDPSNLRRAAAKLFIQALDSKDRIGVIGFSDNAYVVWPLQPVPESRDRIGQEIDNQIRSAGGTDISDSLKAAYAQLNDGGERRKLAVLLTDGQQDGDPYDPQWQAAFSDKSWPVFTFGLSNQADTTRLQNIADSTGGIYEPLTSASQLSNLYNKLRIEITGSKQILDQTNTMKQGETQIANVSVPSEARAATFITSWPGSRIDMAIQAPDGTVISPDTRDAFISHLKEGTFEIYRVLYPQAGTWQIIAYGAELDSEGEEVALQADVSVIQHQIFLPVVGNNSASDSPSLPTSYIAIPNGKLRFTDNAIINAGSRHDFEVLLSSGEDTTWSIPSVTSDCGLTGLPDGFSTDTRRSYSVATQLYIPPDAAGKLCTISTTVTTSGAAYPQTTFPLSLQFTVPPSDVSTPTPSSTPTSTIPPSVGTTLRIEAGGSSNYSDSSGQIWTADTGFTGGNTVDRGNISIANTNDPRIYQTERYGMSDYTLPVTAGNYTVRLHFAETSNGITRVGGRVFNVNIEGTSINNLDIFAETGSRNKALIKSVNVAVADGQLSIHFTPITENTEINGIEILPFDGTVPTNPTSTPTSTTTPLAPPAAPTDLQVTVVSDTQLRLEWKDHSSREAGFTITDGTSALATVGSNITSYTIGGLTPNTQYCFQVFAFNNAGASDATPITCKKTEGPPLAPSDLTVTVLNAHSLRLNWVDHSGKEQGFHISDGVSFNIDVGPNITSYTVTDLPGNSYRCYHVSAFGAYGSSTWTDWKCATTAPANAVDGAKHE